LEQKKDWRKKNLWLRLLNSESSSQFQDLIKKETCSKFTLRNATAVDYTFLQKGREKRYFITFAWLRNFSLLDIVLKKNT
jgi:hypothetical protein